jgi:hypothetical protein
MYELITALLTTLVYLNRIHKRNKIDSKIANVATSKVLKNRFLDVSLVISIKFSYPTATVTALYECTDRPTGQPSDN